jgi:aspartate-semialdehyde dehydrogenase
MKKYNVGVVGIGLVGSEMVKVLRQRNFPAQKIRVFATRERDEEIAGEKFSVEVATDKSFEDLDVVFFAGTEGARGASQQFGWKAVEAGAYVIDNGDDFRLDDRVPLVVPEVNPHALSRDRKFIANPNCSTIQMVVALAPLHRVAKIKRVVVATYQSVSGTGRSAIKELTEQTKAALEGKEVPRGAYPKRIAFNLFPQISSLFEGQEYAGYFKEEVKMIRETRKILEEPELRISATCVRVPVYFGHSESINVEFEKELRPDEAREILAKSPGIKVIDAPSECGYPVPVEAEGKDEVFVGRIRQAFCSPFARKASAKDDSSPASVGQDASNKKALEIWVVSDNIRKGAALNAVQIAEELIRKKLL